MRSRSASKNEEALRSAALHIAQQRLGQIAQTDVPNLTETQQVDVGLHRLQNLPNYVSKKLEGQQYAPGARNQKRFAERRLKQSFLNSIGFGISQLHLRV